MIWLWRWLGPAGILLFWVGVTEFGFINPLYLSSLGETTTALKKILFLNQADILATTYRTVSGFFIAFILAIPAGVVLGRYQKLYWSFEFVIDFFRSIPAPALFPLTLLFFGIGDLSKIAISSFVAFWVILINTIHGVWHVSAVKINVGKIFGASPYQSLRHIIFFDALPEIFTGLRTGLSLSLILVVVAEISIGTKLGLGQKVFDSYTVYRIPDMYGYILIIGALGFGLNKLVRYLEVKAIHWNK